MPELERIIQGTPGTVSKVWYEAGVAVDPGVTTIGITRWDGTVLVAAGTGTIGSGAAGRSFNILTSHTQLLDRLMLTWASADKGTAISYVEVVGGRLFTLSEALARPELASMLPQNIDAARLRAEQYLERRCGGRGFFPMYSLDSIPADGALLVEHPSIRSIRSVLIGGQLFSAEQLTSLRWAGQVVTGYQWAVAGRWAPVTIGYEYGDDFPEEPVRDAALDLAGTYLTAVEAEAGIDPRATRITTSEGTIQFGVEPRSVQHIIRDYSLRLPMV